MLTMTSVEAQNRFGQLLDAAQREPIIITRHGRPAAFIVSPQDMDELTKARQKRNACRRVAKLARPVSRLCKRVSQACGPTGLIGDCLLRQQRRHLLF